MMTKTRNNIPGYGFRVGVWAIAILAMASAILYVSSRVIVPNGVLTLRTTLTEPAPFIAPPKPHTRIQAMGDKAIITGNPVYIDLSPPSAFDTVTMTVQYETTQDTVLELGALTSALDETFAMRPGTHGVLDTLDWRSVAGSGKLTLYDNTQTYASVEEFLRNPPDRSRTAEYFAEIPLPFVFNGSVQAREPLTHTISLRGSHAAYMVVEEGTPFSLELAVQDMNRQKGGDPAILSIFKDREQTPIGRTVLLDDGNTEDNQQSQGLRTMRVDIPDATPGIYRMEFSAPADIFIRSITTPQQGLVFIERVYLGDHVGYSQITDPVTLFTDGRNITARTAHADAFQTIMVEDAPLVISETLTPVRATIQAQQGALASVTSPKRSVILETDGVFALSKESYVMAQPYRITWSTTEEVLADKNIDFILTTYETPRKVNGLVEVSAVFSMNELATTESGAYRFVLSAPNATLERGIPIAQVSFTLRRNTTGWKEGYARLMNPITPDNQAFAQMHVPFGKIFNERMD